MRERLTRSLALWPVLVCVVCIAASGQGRGRTDLGLEEADSGTGGNNIIQGTVLYPGGRLPDRQLGVRLRSIDMEERYVYTDDSGSFSFRNLKAGSYSISVAAGKDFKVATEDVDVLPAARRSSNRGNTYTIKIILEAESTPREPAPGTVSAAKSQIPGEAAKLYKEAQKLGEAGESKKAVEDLKKALAVYPEFALALNEMGVQYLKLRQPDKALGPLQAAIKLDPEGFAPALNYGIALVQTKSYASAAQSLQRAVAKDGGSVAAHLYLGRALVETGDYSEAEPELQKAIDLGGEDGIEAHRYLAAAYIETGQTAKAAAELESYLKLNPKVVDAARIRQLADQMKRPSTK